MIETVKQRVVAAVPEPVRAWWPTIAVAGGPVAFVGGVAWNFAALGRIDRPFTSVKLAVLVVLLGVAIALEERIRVRRVGVALIEERGGAVASWVVLFCAGSLYNAYLVFYLKSASSLKMVGFGLLLLGVLLATRFFKSALAGGHVRLVVFLLATFSLLLFLVPVLTGWFGRGPFAVAIVGSLVATALVYAGTIVSPTGAWALWRARHTARFASLVEAVHVPTRREVAAHAALWVAVLGTLVGAEALELIPPVPLAIVHAGVFHEVERRGDAFVVKYEEPPWTRFWEDQDLPFRLDPGDRVHFVTALFAPSGLDVDVVHRWERWDPEKRVWNTTDRIGFTVVGGRDHGFRGFTRKSRVTPGLWRVIVETKQGREIGRRLFRVVEGDGTKELVERTLD